MGIFVVLLITSLVGGFTSSQDVEYSCPEDFMDNSAICSDTRTVGLKEFASGAGSDYFFTTVWSENSYAGYWHFGEVARVAKKQIPGTIPLIRYSDGHNAFTTELSPSPPTWSPLNNGDYVTVYVYKTRVPGTYGLYRYDRAPTHRLVMEYDKDELENLGYVEGGLVGYAYRPCPTQFLG